MVMRSPSISPAPPRAEVAAVPDAAAMAERLRLSATRLARRLRQEASTGLTPSQLSALAQIDHHGALTLGALAERERVAPPTITRVVTKLEAEGLVSRQPSVEDRRVVKVVVTESGADLLARTRRRKDAWLAARLADLDAPDRARLAAALDVLDALTTEDDPVAAEAISRDRRR
jgi:DNA-binding MarR family transcriptional regulator